MQFPGGLLGQRLGARIMLVAHRRDRRCRHAGDAAGAAAVDRNGAVRDAAAARSSCWASRRAPSSRSPPASSRPGSAPTSGRWCRDAEHGAADLGGALAPPLIALADVMPRLAAGARLDDVPALVGHRRVGLVRAQYARRTSVRQRRSELAELARTRAPGQVSASAAVACARQLLAQPRLLLLYVVVSVHELRVLPALDLGVPVPGAGAHFTVLEGGWLASTPAVRGRGRRRHRRQARQHAADALRGAAGLRIMPLIVAARRRRPAVCAVDAANGYVAVAAIALGFAAVELTEGPLLGGDHACRARRQHDGRGACSTPAATSAASIGTPIVALPRGAPRLDGGVPAGSGLALWRARPRGCWWTPRGARPPRAASGAAS